MALKSPDGVLSLEIVFFLYCIKLHSVQRTASAISVLLLFDRNKAREIPLTRDWHERNLVNGTEFLGHFGWNGKGGIRLRNGKRGIRLGFPSFPKIFQRNELNQLCS